MRIHFQWQCFYYTKDKHILLVFFKCAFFLPSEKQVQQCIAVLLTRTKLLLIFKFFALIYRTQNMVGLAWLEGLKPTKHDCLGCLHLTFKC